MKITTIPYIIFGVVSFFLSFVLMKVFEPIISVVTALFDTGFTKTVITLMTYLVFFAVLYIVPFNILLGKHKKDTLEQ